MHEHIANRKYFKLAENINKHFIWQHKQLFKVKLNMKRLYVHMLTG